MTHSDMLLDVARAAFAFAALVYALATVIVVSASILDDDSGRAVGLAFFVPASASAGLGFLALLMALSGS